ncbi:hypothetical protein PV326_009560 [Microctonus aethiopoides]|nr:hypothetical protein PV326_009560 [Microctonus aethiopoides]
METSRTNPTNTSNKRGRESPTPDSNKDSKKKNVSTEEEEKLKNYEIKKLQKELGLKQSTGGNNIVPNLKMTRAKRPDLKDFSATFDHDIIDKSDSEEHEDESEWKTQKKNPHKISPNRDNTVSTILSNKFDALSNNNIAPNLETAPQPKKVLLPIYVMADSGSIRNLAALLRENKEICGKFRLNFPAGSDFNARHTTLGDRINNRHGTYLIEWNNRNGNKFRSKIYPPDSPTYTPASTFLDICIADQRLVLNETSTCPNALPTVDYDSDHRAIIMSIDKIVLPLEDDKESQHKHIPYKLINWRKFGNELLNIHRTEIPTNRNLSNTEIDMYIEILTGNINKTLTKFASEKNSSAMNTLIRSKKMLSLHKLKTNLLTELYKTRKYDPNIQKTATKRIKNELNTTKKMIVKEIAAITEKKWAKLNSLMNDSTPDRTFPIIKKMLKPKGGTKISTLVINKKNEKLINNLQHTINLDMNNIKNDQIHIIDDYDKANTLAARYELVNSPNNLNNNTRLKEIIDKRTQTTERLST